MEYSTLSIAWRRKTHYETRVLIETESILDPQSEDSLLCITGAQLEMLRNLTQYLKYRSTFVSEYESNSYLAPTNDEWDSLQAIVADLEETLMGCAELTALFEDMLVAMQCVCNKTAGAGADLGTVAPIVDRAITDGILVEDDPYSGDTEVEARRCAVAQLTFWQSYEWLTEVIQPIQDNTMDFILPMFFSVCAVLLGATAVGIPAGAAVAMLSVLADVWVEGRLADVQNAVWAHRDELTCAVFQGLSYDYRMAETRAAQVIADISELSPLDAILMRAMYAPWAMKQASTEYTNASAWALAQVDADACDDCDWVYEMVYEFPPSPGTWAGGFPAWTGRWPGLNGGEEGTSVNFVLPSIGAHVDMEIETHFMSKFASGWTVGSTEIEYQDVGLAWHVLASKTATTLKAIGAINTVEGLDEDITVPRNVLRVNMHGQPGQGDSDPWPFMPTYIRVKIFPHV